MYYTNCHKRKRIQETSYRFSDEILHTIILSFQLVPFFQRMMMNEGLSLFYHLDQRTILHNSAWSGRYIGRTLIYFVFTVFTEQYSALP